MDHDGHRCRTQCGLKPNLTLTSTRNVNEKVNAQLFPVEVYPLIARCYAVQFFNNVVNLAYTQAVVRELEDISGLHANEPYKQVPRELTVLYLSVRSMAQSLDLLTCKQCLVRRNRATNRTGGDIPLSVTDGEKLEVTQELREMGIIALPEQDPATFWDKHQRDVASTSNNDVDASAFVKQRKQKKYHFLRNRRKFEEEPEKREPGVYVGGVTPPGSKRSSTTVSSLPMSAGVSLNWLKNVRSLTPTDKSQATGNSATRSATATATASGSTSRRGTEERVTHVSAVAYSASSSSGSPPRSRGTPGYGYGTQSGSYGNTGPSYASQSVFYSNSGSGYGGLSGSYGNAGSGYGGYSGSYGNAGSGANPSGTSSSWNVSKSGKTSSGNTGTTKSGNGTTSSGKCTTSGTGTTRGNNSKSSIGRPSSQMVGEKHGEEVALGRVWKLQLKNAAQTYARGAPNLPDLIPITTFNEALGLIEELIPLFAWLLADARPNTDRDDMIRIAHKFEEWQALKAFPRVLTMEAMKSSCAFVLAQLGLLFAVECLLVDGEYCVENGFLQQKELLCLRAYRVELCDGLKPHMWNMLSRFVEYEDIINIGIKKAWHYANELYQDAHKPPTMRKIFERGEPYRLAMGNNVGEKHVTYPIWFGKPGKPSNVSMENTATVTGTAPGHTVTSVGSPERTMPSSHGYGTADTHTHSGTTGSHGAGQSHTQSSLSPYGTQGSGGWAQGRSTIAPGTQGSGGFSNSHVLGSLAASGTHGGFSRSGPVPTAGTMQSRGSWGQSHTRSARGSRVRSSRSGPSVFSKPKTRSS